MAGAMCAGGGIISYSTPSMRYRILNSSSNGSKWMSEALSLIACSSTRLISLRTGLESAASLRLSEVDRLAAALEVLQRVVGVRAR